MCLCWVYDGQVSSTCLIYSGVLGQCGQYGVSVFPIWWRSKLSVVLPTLSLFSAELTFLFV